MFCTSSSNIVSEISSLGWPSSFFPFTSIGWRAQYLLHCSSVLVVTTAAIFTHFFPCSSNPTTNAAFSVEDQWPVLTLLYRFLLRIFFWSCDFDFMVKHNDHRPRWKFECEMVDARFLIHWKLCIDNACKKLLYFVCRGKYCPNTESIFFGWWIRKDWPSGHHDTISVCCFSSAPSSISCKREGKWSTLPLLAA